MIISYNRNITGPCSSGSPLFTVGRQFSNGFAPLSTSPHAHISISFSQCVTKLFDDSVTLILSKGENKMLFNLLRMEAENGET